MVTFMDRCIWGAFCLAAAVVAFHLSIILGLVLLPFLPWRDIGCLALGVIGAATVLGVFIAL